VTGMVATSHPLAVRAGVETMRAGGTAVDAAVAAAAVLCVVDPRSTGIGGDAFAQVWPVGEGEPMGMAGAGPAPAGLTVEALRRAGFERMPHIGPWAVTVPGAVSAWELVLARFGRLGLGHALRPAIELAERGFEVTAASAREWRVSEHRLRDDEAARALFLPAPRAGETFANPDLGRMLRAIAQDGASAFYRGVVAEAIDAMGGPLTGADLAGWQGAEWVAPLRRGFRGVDVFELPPPGQGVVVLEALGIFEGLAPDDRAAEEHAAIEALKLAFEDAGACVADPDAVGVPIGRLLSDGHLAARRTEVDIEAARPAPLPGGSDTVYVAAVDGDGMACSFIQSVYEGFGSGIAVPGTGMLLHNRGAGFVLQDGHPNAPAPGKRPYHTIIPAMLGREGTFLACLGVVGGFMQPQGQMQIVRHLLDHGMDVEAAVAAPRARYRGGVRVDVEPGYDEALARELARRGHEIGALDPMEAGGAQAILAVGGAHAGASDPRKGGCALSG
jgi:gamma-glutamyltranspeptidase/glutathione hydrolase